MQTTSTTNNPFSAAAAKSDTVAKAPGDANRDMFTKLLVAQIQNQDPLEPQDPTTYVNQLSQLSQTEALQNMSAASTANASMLQSLQTLAMGSQVGADVTVATNTLKLDDAKVKGTIQLNSASSDTSLVLTGGDGVARTIKLAAHGSGAQSFTIDPAALGLPPGTYAIQAKSSDGSSPQIEVTARLNSVRVGNGGVVLQVANVGEVTTSSVTAFNGKAGGA